MRYAICVALVSTLLATAEPAKKDEKAPIREVELKLNTLPKGRTANPIIITNAEELAKAFPAEETQKALAKQVDFTKEKLLYFGWSGSGADTLTSRLSEDKKEIIFTMTPGLTRDLRGHNKAFVVDKDAKFKMGVGR